MRDSTKGILIGILGTLVLVAAALVAWRVGSRAGVVLTDGAGIRVPAAQAPVREVLWEPVGLLPEWINQGDENYEPRLSNDGRTLVFVRGRAGGAADLYGAELGEEGWGEAFALGGVNTPGADELGPALSADGRTLFFYSDRAGGFGGYDLWRVRRVDGAADGGAGAAAASLRDAAWGEAENLGPAVNSPFNDYGPAPAPDGSMVYFASNRPEGATPPDRPDENWPATVREAFEHRDYDLYVTRQTGRGLGEAERVEALATEGNEGTPAISPAGDYLYFSSDREGGAGGLDIWRARLRDGAPLEAEPIGWPVNTAANELDPALSMNGFALHFSSNRERGAAGDRRAGPATGVSSVESTPAPDGASGREAPADEAAAARRYAIYSTLSREVFREREPVLAGFDWGAAWSAVWPWLLLLALLLGLLYLLRRFLRDEQMKRRWRTLSLLAKCLILSLLLHALLAGLFTVWYVAGSVGDLLRRPGGTRVALVSRSVGSDLASQIRGGLTEFEVEAQTPVESRATPRVETEARMIEASFQAERAESRDERLQTADAAAESAPEVPAPAASEATVQVAAAAPDSLATPQAESARAASEANLTTRAVDAALPAASADVPQAAEGSRAEFQVLPQAAADSRLATPSAATADAVPAAAGPLQSTPASIAIDTGPGATDVATPSAAATDVTSERAVQITPTRAAPQPEVAAPLPSTAAASPAGSLAPEPMRAADRRLAPSAPTAIEAGAASAMGPSPPAGASIEIAPGTASVSTALPTSTATQRSSEAVVRVAADEPAPQTARPALHTGTINTTSSAPLAPAASGAAPDVALGAGASVAAAESASPDAASSVPSRATIPTIPALDSSVSTALPAASDARVSAETSLAASSVAPSDARTEARATPTPAAISAAPLSVNVALPAAMAVEEARIPMAGAASDAAPLAMAAPPSSIAIDIASSASVVDLALPTAARSSVAEESDARPIQTDRLADADGARPGLALAPSEATPPTTLELEAAGRDPRAEPSLADATPPAARDASSTATASTPPTPTIPIDLSSLPIPSLALPEATEEPPAAAEPIGTLAGVITDAQTGEPISGARIRLDLPDAEPIVARSNSRGQYRLRVPEGIPDNVAISATAPGYTPASINVALDDIVEAEGRGEPLDRDFDLTPLDWDVVPIEEDPEVHHLGNDEFEGAINSQFQRSSEGLTYLAEFDLGQDQVYPEIRAAEIVLLAKGAQANNPIRINGRELDEHIVGTPGDGSFGELVFRIPPRWLREGVNTIEVFSVRGSNDLDDFEFVNPRLRLRPSEARERGRGR